MAPEFISMAYFINSSHRSVCLNAYPKIIARQRLGREVPATKNTRKIRKIVGGVVFYAVRVVSKMSLWVCLYILSLLGNGLINTFSLRGRIVEGIVFYAVHIVSKESRRLVLTRTSCLFTSLSSLRLLGSPLCARRTLRSKQATVKEPVLYLSYAYCIMTD
jgi:hypothetical protein